MDISVSSYPAGPISAQPQDGNTVEPQQAADSTSDTVQLTQDGQIHALRQQGQAASQIASLLSVPMESVNSVLGTVEATPAAV